MPRRRVSDAAALPKQAKSANKERVRFIFEPDRHSPNGITYTWLIHEAYDGKEKAATATRAFWLPFAYRDKGNSSEAELRELAQQSIWRLEEQIQHLREAFGLEASVRSASGEAIVPPPEIEDSSNWSTNLTPRPEATLLDEFNEVL
jgi:23S rRNA A2030 N6-methylase RlmJ